MAVYGYDQKRKDLAKYIADMEVIASHLEAAISRAVGIYGTNPITHKVPAHDDLNASISSIREEVVGARLAAEKRLEEMPVPALNQRDLER